MVFSNMVICSEDDGISHLNFHTYHILIVDSILCHCPSNDERGWHLACGRAATAAFGSSKLDVTWENTATIVDCSLHLVHLIAA